MSQENDIVRLTVPRSTDFSDLRAVTKEEWFQKVFGKSAFISVTKPKSSIHKENWKGEITHNRKKYYVIAKPGRQQGDAPKVECKYRLPKDLVEAIGARAEADVCNKVDVVEAALTAYLKPPF